VNGIGRQPDLLAHLMAIWGRRNRGDLPRAPDCEPCVMFQASLPVRSIREWMEVTGWDQRYWSPASRFED
jgi:hypothetical protein